MSVNGFEELVFLVKMLILVSSYLHRICIDPIEGLSCEDFTIEFTRASSFYDLQDSKFYKHLYMSYDYSSIKSFQNMKYEKNCHH